MEPGYKIFIPIKPMGAVRTTQKQKFVDVRARNYRIYKETIGRIVKKTMNAPMDGLISAEITFLMPIPDSWPKKKKESNLGGFHSSKPDIDNLVKGVFDAVNGICWNDDRQVCEMVSKKIYSINPGICLEIWGIDDGPKKETEQAAKGTKTD